MTEGGPNEDWDWDEQRADTFGTIAHLVADGAVSTGVLVTLDIQTIAGPQAGPLAKAAYLSALAKAEYTPEVYTDDQGRETIEVPIPDVTLDGDSVWAHEKLISEIALAHQWLPDGWGFWEPDD